jgi:hypothetical protein
MNGSYEKLRKRGEDRREYDSKNLRECSKKGTSRNEEKESAWRKKGEGFSCSTGALGPEHYGHVTNVDEKYFGIHIITVSQNLIGANGKELIIPLQIVASVMETGSSIVEAVDETVAIKLIRI